MFRKTAFSLGLLVLCCAPLAAQQAMPTALTVNGTHMAPTVIIGATDSDVAVLVSPILKATGAKVKTSGSYVEALWNDNVNLVLEAGCSTCTYGGQVMNLKTPCGMLDGDLVMSLGELCTVIGARLEPLSGGSWAMYRAVLASDNPVPAPPAQALAKQNTDNSFNISSGVKTPYDVSESGPPLNAPMNNGGYAIDTSRLGDNNHPLYKKSGVMNAVSPAGRTGVDQFGIPVGMSTGFGGYRGNIQSEAFQKKISGDGYQGGPPLGALPKGIYAGSPQAGIQPGSYQGGMGSMPAPVMNNTVGEAGRGPIPGMFGKSRIGTSLPPNLVGANGEALGSAPEGVRYYEALTPADNALLYPENPEAMNTPALSGPAKISISSFDIQRLMSFRLTSYEIRARIKNEGGTVSEYPIMLRLLAKSKRSEHYDVLYSCVIDPLQPGMEAELIKRVGAYDSPCLVDIKVDFKLSVLEAQPAGPQKSARLSSEHRMESADTPGIERDEKLDYVETCAKTRTMHY